MALLNSRQNYKGDYDANLIEQWSKCVEMANASSDKRISSNNVFITINAALIAILQFTSGWHDALISIVGVVVSSLWYATIKSYRELNTVKYMLINRMEKELPSLPFTEEWRLLKKNKKYTALTKIEQWLPFIFIVLFIITICISLLSSCGSVTQHP